MGKMTQTLENTLKGFGVGNYSGKKKKPEVNLFGLRAWTQSSTNEQIFRNECMIILPPLRKIVIIRTRVKLLSTMCPGTFSKCFTCINLFNSHTTCWEWYYYKALFIARKWATVICYLPKLTEQVVELELELI